jgi:hypothetical protein|tara:strand:- start:134 stop:358 length:225 start_codon:yes stop_codon:yes gene_type:complete
MADEPDMMNKQKKAFGIYKSDGSGGVDFNPEQGTPNADWAEKVNSLPTYSAPNGNKETYTDKDYRFKPKDDYID